MRTTIIYYTANQENPDFERKIQENILKNSGGLPIISVSHKPINFGKNICIGKRPVCYSSSFKQLLIGLKEAKTEFCIATEADTLYPPAYFQFIPPTNDVYRYTNLYVYFEGKNGFWRKRYVEAAQMCNREVWIKNIERVLKGQKGWEPKEVNPPFVFTTKDKYSWATMSPVLTLKTRKGIGFKTGFIQGAQTKIPYWGTVNEIRRKYL